ncbi:etoposide-induced protein 2.4-domain-containing protein [Mycena maculata]|uniref:Etoposide-induced protein 2.4-domain-containing protein n=1 Tax=Mycena maculata TaxID=230809 RepID=A0AAD7IA96_9AGAR|nr:etoposide-induced protein 2.4-domain-containing protein [Mycena maculata]
MASRYTHRPGHASGYPEFLSIQESLLLQIIYAGRGLLDAFRWVLVATTVAGDAEIRSNISKSLLLNSFSLTTLYVFDLLFFDNQQWLRPNVGLLYQLIWLLPVVGILFYLNSSWCFVIAKRTYSLQYANRAVVQQQPVTYTGLLTAIATSAYRVVMVFTSILVSFALRYIPRIGPVAGFIFLCWIDAYYCFEFVWIARGLSLSGRIRHLEERWAYYLAFGSPSAALCTWGSVPANAVVFALIFPLYIIMAIHARPVPEDPYSTSPPGSRFNDNEVIRHPSPYIPIRLPIFALVMWLNDWIVRVLSVGGGRSVGPASFKRNRAFSDGAESVEEGGGGGLGMDRSKPVRSVRGRINIGRRKID